MQSSCSRAANPVKGEILPIHNEGRTRAMIIDKGTLGFLETLNRDSSMRGELAGALTGAGNPMDRVFEFATSKGFAVDRKGLEAAHRILMENSELGDSELDKVAGGFNPQPDPPGRTALADITTNFDQQFLAGW